MIPATPPLDSAHLGGDPAALPTLPRIAPRTGKPVRISGRAIWTEKALAGLAELFWQEQRALAATGMNADAGPITAR